MSDVKTEPYEMTKEEIALDKEITKKWSIVEKHYKDWNDAAKEDFKFALGDQWTSEERTALNAAGRPCLTYNRIRPLIMLISGYQRENSSRIKVNPEGGEDRIFSEVMDRALKAIDKWTHLNYKLGYQFDDGLYCGKGFVESTISYENDPILGELEIKQRSPFQILVDPECLDYDINDGAGYLFKVVRLSKDSLKELYPTKEKLIDGFIKDNDDDIENGTGALMQAGEGIPANDDYGNREPRNFVDSVPGARDEDEGDGKFTVKEYWRFKTVQKYFVINKANNEPQRFDTKDEAQAFVDQQQFGKVIERNIKQMWVAARVCGWILQNEVSPHEPEYAGFPFFRFLADYAPNAEDELTRIQGITRPLKDPQREKNKAKSQSLHILNTQANSGWIGDEDALTQTGWDELKTIGSKPGITIKKKKGAELREILPKGPNAGHMMRDEKADDELRHISLINPDFLMGIDSGKDASGKAVSLRMKNVVLALVRLFNNYKYTKEILGKYMLSMIPRVFDANKLAKVLGKDYMAKAVDQVKYPEGLSEGHLDAFLQMVRDNKYDVLVTEADQNQTIRYEIFQELSELLKAGAPIPINLLIDYMDLPNSEEVKKEVAKQQQLQMQLEAQGAAK